MTANRMDLDAGTNLEQFRTKLGICEFKAVRAVYTEGQERFIKDMRWRVDHRKDNEEVGFVWNPTVTQWNYLGDLSRKV